jgi:hypothetical protein
MIAINAQNRKKTTVAPQPINIGENTHSHDQSRFPVTFSVMKMIVNILEKPITPPNSSKLFPEKPI